MGLATASAQAFGKWSARIGFARASPGRLFIRLIAAKRDSEAHRSELLRLDLEERRGVLVRVANVQDALAAAGEKIVRIIDQSPVEADELVTAVAKGGVPALRLALKEIAHRQRTGIADSLSRGTG
jgi:hypothetical protein